MTIAPVFTETTYLLAAGALGPYSTVWPYAEDSDVQVLLDIGDGQGAKLLTLNLDYTLADDGALPNTGKVTMAGLQRVAGLWPAGSVLTLARATPRAQSAALGEMSGFSPKSVENALDNLDRQVQEISAQLSRALKLGYGEAGYTASLARLRAGKVLGFDSISGALKELSPGQFTGAPGGNIMAVGPMTALHTMVVPAGTNVIRTSGWAADGDGGAANYLLKAAGAVGQGVTADGRVAVYLPQGGVWDLRAFGPAPDGVTAMDAQLAAVRTNVTQQVYPPVGGPTIYYPAAAHAYAFAGVIHVLQFEQHKGDCNGFEISALGFPTTLLFPANSRGFKCERYNTFDNAIVAPRASGADGSRFEGLHLKSSGAYDGVSHGIDTRCRISIERCTVEGYAGHAVSIDSQQADGASANCNEWYINRFNAVNCQGHTLFIDGPNSNAGTSIMVGCIGGGLGGIIDSCFLNNSHYSPHIDECGLLGKGRVTRGGHIFTLIDRTPGIGAATTPGDNNHIWYDDGAGAGPAAWDPAGDYILSCALFSDDVNAVTVFIGVYVETGLPTSQVAAPAQVKGGQFNGTTYSQYERAAIGIQPMSYTSNGFGGFQYLPTGDARGTYAYSRTGYLGLDMVTQATVGARLGPYRSSVASGDIVMDIAAFRYSTTWTGSLTTAQFGRTSIVPYAFNALTLAIGPDTADARVLTNGAAAPTSGDAARGEWVIQQNASPGGSMGYACTTGGVNGSTAVWKAMANLAA